MIPKIELDEVQSGFWIIRFVEDGLVITNERTRQELHLYGWSIGWFSIKHGEMTKAVYLHPDGDLGTSFKVRLVGE